jgi:GTP cyclohydrolase I
MAVDRDACARALRDFLAALGLDPQSHELAGTPERVAAMYADDLIAGYGVDVLAMLRANCIDLDAPAAQGALVAVRDVPVTTTCPHHLTPAQGKATVIFEPDRRIVGVGAVAAAVDAYARRLALQEWVGEDVVSALATALAPRWVACRLHLSHACMTARGERTHGATVETLALRGSPPADAARLAGVGGG